MSKPQQAGCHLFMCLVNNALCGSEDIPNMSLITRLFKKIGPKPHRNTQWWKQTHPAQKSAPVSS